MNDYIIELEDANEALRQKVLSHHYADHYALTTDPNNWMTPENAYRYVRTHRKAMLKIELPSGLKGLDAVLSVSDANSMAGGVQNFELVSYSGRIRNIVNGMPSGQVADSFYAELDKIDTLLRQARGVPPPWPWSDWGRNPDWVASPAFWEKEYKNTKWQLQAMEQEVARRTGAVTTITNVPKQPAVTTPMSPTGEGPAYVAPATPENIIGPTAWNRPPSTAPVADQTSTWVAVAVGVGVIGVIAYMAWPRGGSKRRKS